MAKNGLATTLLATAAFVLAAAGSPAGVPAPTFVYAYDAENSEVIGCSMDAAGVMNPLPGSPYAVPGTWVGCNGPCGYLSWFPKRRLLFASCNEGVAVLRVAADGTVTAVPGSPFGAGSGEYTGTTFVARGRKAFVYAAILDTGEVDGFALADDDTLVHLDGLPVSTGAALPFAMATAKRTVFAADYGVGTLSGFVSGRDGSLAPAPGNPYAGTGKNYTVVSDPGGRYIYSASYSQSPDLVDAFRVNHRTADLVPLRGAPYALPLTDLGSNLVFGRGSLGFALSYFLDGTADIQALRRGKGGVLAALGQPQDSGLVSVRGGVLDARGRRLVVASNADATLDSFLVDGKTGLTTPADTATFTGPIEIDGMVIVE